VQVVVKAKSQLQELRFPVGGLNRQSGFDQQPPYSTPFCRNVRPFDVVNLSTAEMHGMRNRGGARPGLVKAYAQQIGSGPIQLLSFASVLSSAGVASNILLASAGGYLYQSKSTPGSMIVVTGGPHFNTTAKQLRGTQVGQLFYIADFRATSYSGISSGTINAGGLTLTDAALTGYTRATGDVIWISPADPTQSNIFPVSDFTGTTVTFTNGAGHALTPQSGATWQIGRMPKVFNPAAPTAALTMLMGSVPIPPSQYTTGTVTIASGTVTLATGTWPANAAGAILTISSASGIGTQDYLVSVRTSDSVIHLVDATADADMPAGTTYVLSWTSSYYGIPPLGCPLCCTYRGRLVLAGPGAVWYMSRVLNPNDWDYGYDPAGTSTSTGGIPEPILALMPHSDDYLIFGCERSLWLLTGDPAYGGQITALSRDIGVLGPGAWCNLPDGSIVLLSRDGLYQIPAGAQGHPQPISRPKLPAELLDVDWVGNTISMSYDVQARGIHVSVTPIAGTAGLHYFIDMTAGGFWPVVFGANGHQPTAMVRYATDSTVPAQVILGSFDGYLRDYSATATADVNANDTTTAIASLVCYGPFRIGGPGYIGEILQIAADLDPNGQGVAWGVFQGDTAQAAVQAAVTAAIASGATWKGTWSAGANHVQYPRASGAALVIMVSGTYGWAIEGVRIEGRQKGPIR
jgi:hypothetical protein